MIKKLSKLALIAIAMLLAACASQQGTDSGAETSGADIGSDLLSEKVIHFAFDSSAIDRQNAAVIEAHAGYLKSNSNLNVRLEGHCDERGTREYNLSLGERRAQAVARMMKALGVSGSRIKSVSYGEEKPVDSGHDESAWRQNRRAEISY